MYENADSTHAQLSFFVGMTSSSIGSVPQEILEHVAFFAATQNLVGPPSGLLPFLFTCQNVYQALSVEVNPYLYARIFSSKFDTRSAFRRLGPHVNTPRVLANELRKRCILLKRIRTRTDARILDHAESSPSLIHSLWLAYLMMLENDGKNERHLLEYAEMDIWLLEYWFDFRGASSATDMISQRVWLVENEENSIAMWLFWFLLRPDFVSRNVPRERDMMTVMELIALAANHYPICRPSWTEFLPRSEAMMSPSLITHFSESYRLHPPTLAPAAILAFLTLSLRAPHTAHHSYAMQYSLHSPASLSLATRRSEDWDADWYRCISAGLSDRCRGSSETYVLGSLEGVWEGIFTYTEFTSYSLLLTGGAPPISDHPLTAQHRQTWKLREYHLLETQDPSREQFQPFESGDPLRAYFNAGTRFQEGSDSIKVEAPGRGVVHYRRSFHAKSDAQNVTDVIILGEGHSAWGQFSLYGRVRLLDGLISLSKQYAAVDRGRWLYRGYLIGNVNGHISGRWRDTMSPADTHGYEGCFVLGRRR